MSLIVCLWDRFFFSPAWFFNGTSSVRWYFHFIYCRKMVKEEERCIHRVFLRDFLTRDIYVYFAISPFIFLVFSFWISSLWFPKYCCDLKKIICAKGISFILFSQWSCLIFFENLGKKLDSMEEKKSSEIPPNKRTFYLGLWVYLL